MQRMTFGTLDLAVIDPHERDTRYIYDEIFEAQIYYHPQMRMPRHPVIVDVGANIGIFSIWAHRRHQPRAIYAYEASPATFAYLEANLARHVEGEVTAMHAVNRAVARRPGETLTLHQAPFVSGLSTLLGTERIGWLKGLADKGEVIEHKVETTSLSTEMQVRGIEQIDLLKIDVEGYFPHVLAGIDEMDFARIRNIVAEIDYAEEVGVSVADVVAMLSARGYLTEVDELTLYAWRE